MVGEVCSLTGQAGRLGAFASVAASLVVILEFFRSKRPATTAAAGKSSWWRTAFKGATMLYTFWKVFRPPVHKQAET